MVTPPSGPFSRYMLRPRLALPSARTEVWPLAALRWLWTLPTNLLGHLIGLAVCRRRGRRVGGVAANGYLYQMALST